MSLLPFLPCWIKNEFIYFSGFPYRAYYGCELERSYDFLTSSKWLEWFDEWPDSFPEGTSFILLGREMIAQVMSHWILSHWSVCQTVWVEARHGPRLANSQGRPLLEYPWNEGLLEWPWLVWKILEEPCWMNEWNMEFGPKAQRWDQQDHSVPSWKL